MTRLFPFRFLASGLFVLAFILIFKSPVSAHAVLVESIPAVNSIVSGPDIPIKLRFNSRIDKARSTLTLVRPDGSTQRLEIDKQTSADALASQATGLAKGAYVLRWQVLASDGHTTRGEVRFNVG
jgi:copper resistance protein C